MHGLALTITCSLRGVLGGMCRLRPSRQNSDSSDRDANRHSQLRDLQQDPYRSPAHPETLHVIKTTQDGTVVADNNMQ